MSDVQEAAQGTLDKWVKFNDDDKKLISVDKRLVSNKRLLSV
jgi:hypothetical protein